MLSSLLLYLLFAAGGIFIGAKVLKPDREYKWIGRLQSAALMILIFTMGVNIGADERVLSSVGTLGVRALIVSLCAVAGSVLFVFAGRKLMGLDRKGRKISDAEDEACPVAEVK